MGWGYVDAERVPESYPELGVDEEVVVGVQLSHHHTSLYALGMAGGSSALVGQGRLLFGCTRLVALGRWLSVAGSERVEQVKELLHDEQNARVPGKVPCSVMEQGKLPSDLGTVNELVIRPSGDPFDNENGLEKHHGGSLVDNVTEPEKRPFHHADRLMDQVVLEI